MNLLSSLSAHTSDIVASGGITAIIFLGLPYLNTSSPPPHTELELLSLEEIQLPPPAAILPQQQTEQKEQTIHKPILSRNAPIQPSIPLPAITDFDFTPTTPQADLSLNFTLTDAPQIITGSAFPLSEVDKLPRPLAQLQPIYPTRARVRGIQGEVAAEFTITAHGRTQDIRIVSAHPAKIFNRAARHAIARWQFTPAMLNGQPVAVIMHQTIRFKLKQKE